MSKPKDDAIVSTMNAVMIDPRKIEETPGFNYRRKDPTTGRYDVSDIIDSIREQGVVEPITVRKNMKTGVYELRSGHRRHAAVMQLIESEGLPIAAIPALIEKQALSETESFINAVLTNLSRRELEPIEEGEAYLRFVKWGWTQEKIAKQFGRSQAHVSMMVTIASNASEELKTAIATKEVTASEAVAIVRQADTQQEQSKGIALVQQKKQARSSARGGSQVSRKPLSVRQKVEVYLAQYEWATVCIVFEDMARKKGFNQLADVLKTHGPNRTMANE